MKKKKKVLIFIFMIFAGNLSCQDKYGHKTSELRLDYLFDRSSSILFDRANINNSYHQFFVSGKVYNSIRVRTMFGFKNAVFANSASIKGNHSWAIGVEKAIIRNDKRLFLTYGFEVGNRAYNFDNSFSINSITRISYRINSSILIISEPLALGIARINYNQLPSYISHNWELYSGRILAFGLSIMFH